MLEGVLTTYGKDRATRSNNEPLHFHDLKSNKLFKPSLPSHESVKNALEIKLFQNTYTKTQLKNVDEKKILKTSRIA